MSNHSFQDLIRLCQRHVIVPYLLLTLRMASFHSLEVGKNAIFVGLLLNWYVVGIDVLRHVKVA